jgi:hypothetical protein
LSPRSLRRAGIMNHDRVFTMIRHSNSSISGGRAQLPRFRADRRSPRIEGDPDPRILIARHRRFGGLRRRAVSVYTRKLDYAGTNRSEKAQKQKPKSKSRSRLRGSGVNLASIRNRCASGTLVLHITRRGLSADPGMLPIAPMVSPTVISAIAGTWGPNMGPRTVESVEGRCERGTEPWEGRTRPGSTCWMRSPEARFTS